MKDLQTELNLVIERIKQAEMIYEGNQLQIKLLRERTDKIILQDNENKLEIENLKAKAKRLYSADVPK